MNRAIENELHHRLYSTGRLCGLVGWLMFFVVIGLGLALLTGFGVINTSWQWLAILLPLLVYFIVACGLIVLPEQLQRRQMWGAVTLICLTSVATFLTLMVFICIALDLRRQMSAELIIPAGVVIIVIAVLVILIYRLAGALSIIGDVAPEERGFQPIMNDTHATSC
jgi:cytochrome bd-type quinol oxidase subunit 2